MVVPGRGEHAQVYRRFARRIAFDGYVVTVLDSDAASLDDINVLAAQEENPVVLVGSDSGAVTALAAARTLDNVAAVVVAGLLADTDENSPQWSDELEVRSACPVHRGVLASEGALDAGALTGATETLTAASLHGVEVPVLVVHGDGDVVSPADTVIDLVAALPDAQVVLVSGGRHDILNDVTHRAVAAEVVQFLEQLRNSGQPQLRRLAARTYAS